MDSVNDIIQKVQRGEISKAQADDVIARLKSQGLVSEEDYTSYQQNSNFQSPGQGIQVQGINPNSSGFNTDFLNQPNLPTIQNPSLPSSEEERMRQKGYSEEEIQYRLKNYNSVGNNGIFPSSSETQGYTPEEQAQLDASPYYKDGKNVGADGSKGFPYIYAGGTDINTKANTFGRFLGAANDGKKGAVTGSVLSGLSLGLDLTRNVLSGLGDQKVTDATNQYWRKKRAEVNVNDYIPATDYSTTINTYAKGGEYSPDQTQQLLAQAAQALKQGTDPKQIFQTLVENNIGPDQAKEFVEGVLSPKQESAHQENEKNEPSVAELLTGEKIKGLKPEEGNVTVEGKEFVQFPDGTTQQATGPSHAEGGVKLEVPDGTKFLSQQEKIGKIAKKLNSTYDLGIKDSDTYASVLEKYTRKIGLKKLYAEEEDLMEMLKKQQKTKDESTQNVNINYLAGKIKQIEDKKAEKEILKQKFFDTLYSHQEDSKPKSKGSQQTQEVESPVETQSPQEDPEFGSGGMYYAEGGEYDAFKKTLNGKQVKPEELQKQFSQAYASGKISASEYTDLYNTLKTEYKFDPAQKPQFQNKFNENTYSSQPVVEQRANDVAYGEPKTKEQIVLNLYRNFPDIVTNDQVFGKNVDKEQLAKGKVVFTKDISFNKENDLVLNLQKKVDERMRSSANDIIKNAAMFDPQTVAEANKYLSDQTFTGHVAKGASKEDKVRSYDQKMGNFTSGRYSMGLNTLTPDEQKDLNTKGVYTLNQVTPEVLANLSPESQQKIKTLQSVRSATSDYTLNTYTPTGTPAQTDAKTPVGATAKEGAITDTVMSGEIDKRPKNFYHPAQIAMAPSPLMATYMGQVNTQYIDPIQVSADKTIQELSDGFQELNSQLDSLPPSQRAAVLASGTATLQSQRTEAESRANEINSANRQRAEEFNINQFDKYQGANNAFKQNFNNSMEKASALREESLSNYFDFNQKVALNNKAIDDKYNLLGSIFDFEMNRQGNQIEYAPNSEFKLTKPNPFKPM